MFSRKKIFDIIPPLSQKEKIEIVVKKSRPKRIIPLFITAVLLSALVSSYFLIPPAAKIELWPKKKSIEETATVIASPARHGENFMPADVLAIEKTISQSFTAEGKKIKATKAQGFIRVYNNYSAVPQTLVASTRFVSDDGKLFRAPKRAVIPGGSYDGGKFVPGFGDIEIMADQPGEEYNINPSTFSIPGFVGTPKYTAFYVKSFEPMKGGAKKEVAYVTQEDLDKAKDTLTKVALAESDAAIKASISSGKYVLIDKAISVKTADFKASAALGDEVDNFSAEIKAAAKAPAIRERDLRDFSRSYIQGKITPGERLIEDSLKVEYSPETVYLEKNEIALKLAISAQSYALPEEVQMKEMIKNKNIKEVENIFKEFSGVEKARVEFWPFWVSLAPERLENIKVLLHLD